METATIADRRARAYDPGDNGGQLVTMASDYYIIDVFASEPGMGNPAAVVLDARGLTDDRMGRIAADFNLSETTFILPPEDENPTGGADLSVRFRWFTPTTEVDLCGHASVAGLQAMFDSGRLSQWAGDPAVHVRIETRSGDLNGFIERVPGVDSQRMIWLTLPPSGVLPFAPDWTALAAALGVDRDAFTESIPPVRTRDGDLIAFVRDVATLNGMVPDFEQLATVLRGADARGLSVATTATLTPSVHVQSRFFAPTMGVNEDPVTGSVTGPLAIHLVRQGVVAIEDGTAALACVQGIPGGRTGLVYALVEHGDGDDYAVRIGGRAIVVSTGTLDDS